MTTHLEIGAKRRLNFVSNRTTFTDFFENFEGVLNNLDASRLRICQVVLRDGAACGRFYWAKRSDQRACSNKHGRLLRAKEWLNTKKGQRYYKGRLKGKE